MLIHASCVLFCGKGVLLTGESGAGKSDLALRLIEAGGKLVSDDWTEVFCGENGCLRASAPEKLRGLLEIRHVGICRFPFEEEAEVAAIFRLLPDGEEISRLPEIRRISYFQKENEEEGTSCPEQTVSEEKEDNRNFHIALMQKEASVSETVTQNKKTDIGEGLSATVEGEKNGELPFFSEEALFAKQKRTERTDCFLGETSTERPEELGKAESESFPEKIGETESEKENGNYSFPLPKGKITERKEKDLPVSPNFVKEELGACVDGFFYEKNNQRVPPPPRAADKTAAEDEIRTPEEGCARKKDSQEEDILVFSPPVLFFDLHPFEVSAVCKIKAVLTQNFLPLDRLL